MRIVHVTSASNMVYGAVHSMMTLARAQRDRGHDVQFVTFEGRSFGEEVAALGWKQTPFRVRTKLDPFAARKMAKFFREEQIDIVHTHLSTSSINGCFAAKLAKIPSVATVHGMSGKLSFIFADHMIGVSEGVRQHMISQGIKPDRVTAVYNGVELPKDLPTQVEARKMFQLPQDALAFGTVARLTPLKGIEHSLKAFAKICVSLPGSIYVLVGDGDNLEQYQTLATDLGIRDSVYFLGYQTNVFQPLKAMDIFLFPSLKEAMGISVAEALAMGLPVVSTNVGGLPEVVTDEVGALVPPEDFEAMASAALQLAQGNIAEVGAQAKDRAERLFSVQSMYHGTDAVYKALRRLQ